MTADAIRKAKHVVTRNERITYKAVSNRASSVVGYRIMLTNPYTGNVWVGFDGYPTCGAVRFVLTACKYLHR